jgi:thymidylate synthase (FAD)
MINGNKISYEDSGLSKREWNELMEVIDKKDLVF